MGYSPSDSTMPISVGDVIGCCLDLEREVAWFTKNGSEIPGHLVFHRCREMVTPAISFSAGIRCVQHYSPELNSEVYVSNGTSVVYAPSPVPLCHLEISWAGSTTAPHWATLVSMKQCRRGKR